MAKLTCLCGHLIVDQTDRLTYKGYFFPDAQVEDTIDSLSEIIDSLVAANIKGNRSQWIKDHFNSIYPRDLKDSDMFFDLVIPTLKTKDIYTCENCGRLAIQIDGTNQFEFFKPESH